MNSDLYFDGKKYISSSRAAKISGYVNDYIGQLCRDGKLECRMIGRSWYVSFDSLIAHKNANGSPAKSKSQKLVKIEQVTVARIEDASALNFEPHEKAPTSVAAEVVSTKSSEAFTVPAEKKVDAIAPRENALQKEPAVSDAVAPELPLFAFDLAAPVPPKIQEVVDKSESKEDEDALHRIPLTVSREPVKVTQHVFNTPKIITPVVSTIISINDIPKTHHDVFGKVFPKIASLSLSAIIAFIGLQFMLSQNAEQAEIYARAARETSSIVSRVMSPVVSLGGNVSASATSGVQDAINGLSINVYKVVQSWTTSTTRVILAITNFRDPPKKEYTDDSPAFARESPTEGLVVVPITAKTDKEATVAKIKKTFSDEVSVEVGGSGSDGVIKPVFRESKGDDYLYVLVPINN